MYTDVDSLTLLNIQFWVNILLIQSFLAFNNIFGKRNRRIEHRGAEIFCKQQNPSQANVPKKHLKKYGWTNIPSVSCQVPALVTSDFSAWAGNFH